MSNSLRPHMTVAYQVPLSMGFSRQEYWSGLPFPSPDNDSFMQTYILPVLRQVVKRLG